MKAKTILEGCGAGILIMLPYAWTQFSPHHRLLYHSLLPSHAPAWGTLIDLVGLSAIATFFFAYLEKKDTGLRSAAWSLVAAGFATVLLYVFVTVETVMGVVPLSLRSATETSPHPRSGFLFSTILIAGLVLYRFWPRAYRSSTKVLRLLLVLVGFSMIWMIPELLYFGLAHQPVESASFEQAPPAAATLAQAKDSPDKGRRIVWLLFDELSYDQTFDHPYPGVALPVFNQLKRESFLFEALRPAGYLTERVVPSFFIGDVIDGLQSDLQGRAWVKLSGEKGWRYFDERRTLFAVARQAGWTTGVVGWYNPYCRMLARSLDSCFWRPALGQTARFEPDNSVWENALAPIRNRLLQPAHRDLLYRQDQENDYRAVMQRAQALIRNQDIRFIFIHLPVPHPPGIYDRKTGQLRAGGTYLDNLVLADRSLGELMSTLNRTASASRTTVVICSDHSWRVPIWRAFPGWTKEEEAATGGKFDPRPVLMIHFPGQSSEVPIPQPFDEIRLHAILLQMLRGDLNSPAELTSWLDGNPSRQRNLNLAQRKNLFQENAPLKTVAH